MTQEEQKRLAEYKQQGTLSQVQALDYHDLLKKEEQPVAVVEVKKTKRSK